jgi:hypothetical protein
VGVCLYQREEGWSGKRPLSALVNVHERVIYCSAMETITEASRSTPVAAEVDICVVGGSCTGVFAAVAAARLGLRVALIEAGGSFGGVATAGLVNIWHSTRDTEFRRTIIGGLTAEVIERLGRRHAVREVEASSDAGYVLNTEELKIELDELTVAAQVRPFLHARFVTPAMDGDRIVAAIIEDKTGRRAIRAAQFIDATGDGDLLVRAGLPGQTLDDLQPPTTCAILAGLEALAAGRPEFDLTAAVFDDRADGNLQRGFLWTSKGVGQLDATMVAGTRVWGADCADADQLTQAEIEGRRQVRVMCDRLRRLPGGEALALTALPSCIGIRETRHAACLHTLTESEVLEGVRFPDAIANGSYRVDVHHSGRPGLTFRYLDGREVYAVPGEQAVEGRWRPATAANPAFYQIPYRSLVPRGAKNLLVAGRLIGADRGAYGAVRVMVNCNQTGEAAGTAAALALRYHHDVADVEPAELRRTLAEHGAIII